MALVKWEPRREPSPFRSLREEVDRVFEEFFRGWPGPWAYGAPAGPGPAAAPSVDLKETEHDLVLTAEVPGVTKDELSVTITEDSVTLKGERRRETESRQGDYHYRETTRGSFQRVIPLPVEIVSEKAQARLKDGVLTLTLPKAGRSRTRAIRIEVE